MKLALHINDFAWPIPASELGQTLIGAELAVKYGVQDVGGRQPPSYRDTHKVAPHVQYPNIIR